MAAWEPGEGAHVAGNLGKTQETQAAEKLRSLCLLHICGAASCGREKGGVGVKEAQGDGATSNLCPSEGAAIMSQQEDTVI